MLFYRARFVLILEDAPARIDAMRLVLANILPDCHLAIFDNIRDWIVWAEAHLADVTLICLDHDLGPNRIKNGEPFDPGIGREAADFLAGMPPISPVIVHSTNTLAVPEMLRVLAEAGWPCSAVTPSDHLPWIHAE